MSFGVWLTGLSGSGKSAIARELLAALQARGLEPALLESDVLRTQLTPRARYDASDRDFFYGTLARLAALIVEAGRPAIVDATANRRAYRERARAVIARFTEVFVDTPLEVCEARDTKGLYRKARAGGDLNLPGVRAPYEPPAAPEVVVRGNRGTPAEGAAVIVAWLESRGWLA